MAMIDTKDTSKTKSNDQYTVINVIDNPENKKELNATQSNRSNEGPNLNVSTDLHDQAATRDVIDGIIARLSDDDDQNESERRDSAVPKSDDEQPKKSKMSDETKVKEAPEEKDRQASGNEEGDLNPEPKLDNKQPSKNDNQNSSPVTNESVKASSKISNVDEDNDNQGLQITDNPSDKNDLCLQNLKSLNSAQSNTDSNLDLDRETNSTNEDNSVADNNENKQSDKNENESGLSKETKIVDQEIEGMHEDSTACDSNKNKLSDQNDLDVDSSSVTNKEAEIERIQNSQASNEDKNELGPEQNDQTVIKIDNLNVENKLSDDNKNNDDHNVVTLDDDDDDENKNDGKNVGSEVNSSMSSDVCNSDDTQQSKPGKNEQGQIKNANAESTSNNVISIENSPTIDQGKKKVANEVVQMSEIDTIDLSDDEIEVLDQSKCGLQLECEDDGEYQSNSTHCDVTEDTSYTINQPNQSIQCDTVSEGNNLTNHSVISLMNEVLNNTSAVQYYLSQPFQADKHELIQITDLVIPHPSTSEDACQVSRNLCSSEKPKQKSDEYKEFTKSEIINFVSNCRDLKIPLERCDEAILNNDVKLHSKTSKPLGKPSKPLRKLTAEVCNKMSELKETSSSTCKDVAETQPSDNVRTTEDANQIANNVPIFGEGFSNNLSFSSFSSKSVVQDENHSEVEEVASSAFNFPIGDSSCESSTPTTNKKRAAETEPAKQPEPKRKSLKLSENNSIPDGVTEAAKKTEPKKKSAGFLESNPVSETEPAKTVEPKGKVARSSASNPVPVVETEAAKKIAPKRKGAELSDTDQLSVASSTSLTKKRVKAKNGSTVQNSPRTTEENSLDKSVHAPDKAVAKDHINSVESSNAIQRNRSSATKNKVREEQKQTDAVKVSRKTERTGAAHMNEETSAKSSGNSKHLENRISSQNDIQNSVDSSSEESVFELEDFELEDEYLQIPKSKNACSDEQISVLDVSSKEVPRFPCTKHCDNKYECFLCDKKFKNPYLMKPHLMLHMRKMVETEIANAQKQNECMFCEKPLHSKLALKYHIQKKHFMKEDPKHACNFCTAWFASKDDLMNHFEMQHKSSFSNIAQSPLQVSPTSSKSSCPANLEKPKPIPSNVDNENLSDDVEVEYQNINKRKSVETEKKQSQSPQKNKGQNEQENGTVKSKLKGRELQWLTRWKDSGPVESDRRTRTARNSKESNTKPNVSRNSRLSGDFTTTRTSEDSSSVVTNKTSSPKRPGRPRQKCKCCPKFFSTSTQLRRHVTLAHTPRMNELKCHFCKLEFSSKLNVEKHIKTVHPTGSISKNDHVCKVCDVSFPLASHLDQHQRVVHGDEDSNSSSNAPSVKEEKEVFRCPICQKTTKSLSFLMTHLRNKHSDVV